jgi:Chaperone of endosialidase
VKETKRKNYMNPVIPLRKAASTLAVVAALVSIAQAVNPPPDGGYPGGNTAEGQAALLSLTSGGFNTAVGWLALRSNTENGFNTAVGAGALFANVSAANTATGTGALLSNTFGGNNTANGMLALFSNTTGQSNTACGAGALLSNTTADANSAIGFHALFSSTTGGNNTAAGQFALSSNTEGNRNTAIGDNALPNNTTGYSNTAIGSSALTTNVTGASNTAVGFGALFESTGSGNTALGAGAGNSVTTASSVICIHAAGADVNDSCYIGNIWNQPGGSQAVYVNSDGKLGAQVSSRRFKDKIKPIGQASQAIYALNPVSFRYKAEIEPTRPLGFGLIAEDVQKVNADLVMRDADGKPASVRYDAVNAMLLNEFLKEHKKVEELQKSFQARLAEQQRQIEALTSGLQKMSAQIELSKFATGRTCRGGPSPRTAFNDQ